MIKKKCSLVWKERKTNLARQVSIGLIGGFRIGEQSAGSMNSLPQELIVFIARGKKENFKKWKQGKVAILGSAGVSPVWICSNSWRLVIGWESRMLSQSRLQPVYVSDLSAHYSGKCLKWLEIMYEVATSCWAGIAPTRIWKSVLLGFSFFEFSTCAVILI